MNETTTQILDGMNDAARAIGEWKRHSAPVSDTVLTIAEPIDGVWDLCVTDDGQPVVVETPMYQLGITVGDALELTTKTDSDAAAAAEHAVDLLRDDFDIVVTSIVYPDGSTVVC